MTLLDWIVAWWAGTGGPTLGPTATPPPSTPSAPPAPTSTDVDGPLLAAHNAARAEFGRPPLATDARLVAVSARFAAEIAGRGVLTHDRLSGVPFDVEIAAALGREVACAENAAEGQPDVPSVLASWMASPGHRANLLGPYTTFGGALAVADDGTPYWVCDFAA